MRINSNIRNVAIVLVIAAVVAAVTGGRTAANTAISAVSLIFLLSISWIASRLYREHRVSLYALGDARRAILYMAVGVATLTFSASPRLTGGGPGTVVFLVVLAACAYAVFAVYRSAREY